MHMRIILLVMKSGIPFQISATYFLRRGNIVNVPLHKIAPYRKIVVPHSFRVVTAKRDNMGPDVALVHSNLAGGLGKVYWLVGLGEQSVTSDAHSIWSCTEIIYIDLTARKKIHVVVNYRRYAFGSVPRIFIRGIFFVFGKIF